MTCTTSLRGKERRPRARRGSHGASKPQYAHREAAGEGACRKTRRRTKKRARHHDAELIGLGLAALGIFLACVLWFGLSGGPVPNAARGVIGWAAYISPLILIPLGGLIVTRSALVSVRPFRLGLCVTVAGLMLALGSVARRLDRAAAQRPRREGHRDDRRDDPRRAADALRSPLPHRRVAGALLRSSGTAVRSAHTRVRRERAPRPLPEPAPAYEPSDSYHPLPRQEAPVDAVHDYPDLVSASVPSLVPELTFAGGDDDTEDTQTALFETDAEPKPEYRLPDPGLLRRSAPGTGPNAEANKRTAEALLLCLSNFGIEATIVGQISGPRVTRYELQLAPGTKVGKVAALRDDLCYALATTEIRILAPIPGKQAVGVEVPNLSPNLVTLGDIYGEIPAGASPVSVWLGKGIDGVPVYCDLARMPHLLIAGTTGSGKSGCINAILTSILLRSTPDQVKMILIDPKRIELNYYESIPHLLTPVVSSPKEASAVLLNVVTEMERRYVHLQQLRARGLPEANRTLRKRGEPELPFLLVVIDELADLMMVSPQDVEDAIIRLAQKSRAVGIHLVLATQRPSVDVITGMIKANVPSRIAFAVSSQTDSRVILDSNGAESLLGSGDMLYKPLGTSRLQRVQGAYVTEEEVAMIVEQTRVQREQEVDETFLQAPQVFADEGDNEDGEFDPDEDPLLDRAIEVVVTAQTASVSLLQRRLRVGYTRAGRLIDMLERRGIISPYEGSKPRTVLIDGPTSVSA